MVGMKDEFIYLPHNVGEMNRLEHDYHVVGLLSACGSVDVVHIKWGCCLTGDINCAKGNEGYPTFVYPSVLLILIGELLAYMAQHLDHAMTRTLSRLIQM